VLDDSNVGEWVDIPADVLAVATKARTQFSDLLRVALLLEHGGVWVDATCFATQPLDQVPDTRTPSGFFVFRYRQYRIASWFMVAEPDDHVIASLYELMLIYWRTHDTVISYFMFHDMLETLCHLDPRIAAELEATPAIRPNRRMKRRMRDPYVPATFRELMGLSFIHKLTYKDTAANEESGTVFAHLLAHGDGPAA